MQELSPGGAYRKFDRGSCRGLARPPGLVREVSAGTQSTFKSAAMLPAPRPLIWTSIKGLIVLLSLLDGIWGVLKGSWGVLADSYVVLLEMTCLAFRD